MGENALLDKISIMGKSDLDAVAARRQTLTRQLAELEKARAVLGAEDQELEVTERVLNRLADHMVAQASFVQPSNGLEDESTRVGALEALWIAIAGRNGVEYRPLLTRLRNATSRMFS